MSREKGFTLIEIVMVIILLGILAAVAIPRFIDMSGEAKKSSTKGILGGVRGAIAIKYANRALGGNASYPPTPAAVKSAMSDGRMPGNPYMNNATGIAAAKATGIGWLYTPATGAFRSATSGGVGADTF